MYLFLKSYDFTPLKSYDTYPNPMIPVYPMILKIGRFLEIFLQVKPNYEDDYKIINDNNIFYA